MPRAPVVIIGAGFGGLAAAVELAVRGESVVVVEREPFAGGKARAVEVGGCSVEVGPTVLTMRWVFDALFASAGRRLEDDVHLTDADVVARHAFDDGSRLDLFGDVGRSAAAITSFAGVGEAEAYRDFAANGEAIARTVREPFLENERPSLASLIGTSAKIGLRSMARIDAHRTMWRALSSTFKDARLRALFARYATYVGSSPFEAPATLNLIAHVEREGVALVEGGMSRLAAAVADLARSLGVVFRFETQVREVLVSRGRADAVILDGPTGAREVLAASAVIANADVATLASGFLGAAARKACPPATARRSLSAITWAIVGEASGFPLVHHNVFFGADYAAEHRALFEERRLADDPTVYLCAQDRPSHDIAPETRGSERFLVIINAPATADAAPLSNDEVERCERSMLARLMKAGLRLAPRAMVVTTPTAFEERARGTGGALYGEAAHGAFSALTRPSTRTKLPGLFLAGGSVHPGPGVPMAALSGKTAARAVLKDLASRSRSPRSDVAGSTSTG